MLSVDRGFPIDVIFTSSVYRKEKGRINKRENIDCKLRFVEQKGKKQRLTIIYKFQIKVRLFSMHSRGRRVAENSHKIAAQLWKRLIYSHDYSSVGKKKK